MKIDNLKNKVLIKEKGREGYYAVSRKSYNYAAKLFRDSKFLAKIQEFKSEDYKKRYTDIKKFLQENDYPSELYVTVKSILDGKDVYPVELGVSIKIDDQDVSRDLVIITDLRTGESSIKGKPIKIEISSKISKYAFLQYIENSWPEIERIQKLADLKEIPSVYERMKLTSYAIEIIKLKKEGKTFNEIAELMYEKYNDDRFADYNNIKSMYYKYKSFLKVS